MEGRVLEGEPKEDNFCPLVHPSNGQKGWGWAGCKPISPELIRIPQVLVRDPCIPGLPSAAFPRALAGS